jgi:hypothetical protein
MAYHRPVHRRRRILSLIAFAVIVLLAMCAEL